LTTGTTSETPSTATASRSSTPDAGEIIPNPPAAGPTRPAALTLARLGAEPC
jgi:hypothetical protein